ncbi:MAG: hypothetical protein J6Q72_07775 [Clostridia bacterium]|nr:hypothetical protein [Clostridia bacterium]
MNESNINIKERNSNMLVQGVLYLFGSVMSLIIALTPFLSSDAMKIKTVFYIVGGALFALFASMFVLLLYKECNPKNAIVITSRGFYDRNNVGEGILVEWTNVASVKMLKRNQNPFFGIILENTDIVLAQMNKKNSEEMRENIEENLPHIIISQKEVRTPIKDINDIFVKLIRESRVLKHDSDRKAKNNPFTTDDVLRAFGKLPAKEEDVTQDAVDEVIDQQNDEVAANNVSTASPAPAAVNSEPKDAEESVNEDSFYAALKQKTDKNNLHEELSTTSESTSTVLNKEDETDVIIDETDDIPDDMPDEIKEILAKSRSSKISEIEKLLTDSDTPIPHRKQQQEEIAFSATTDSEPVDTETFDVNNESDSIDNLEISLNSQDKTTKNAHDSNTDTKEFITAKVLIEPEEDEDDDTFIIPEPIEYDEEE